MFRRLIGLAAGRFDVIAPGYPGFGHSSARAPPEFAYTFDRLADVVRTVRRRARLLCDYRTSAAP